MKNKFLLLLLVALSYIGANAQINFEDSTAQAVTYWDMNESYTYEIAQTKIKYKDDGSEKEESSRSLVQITVLDSTETSYTVEWRFLQHDIPNLELSPELETLLNSKKYVYRTNAMGEFEELLNWEEVRDNTMATTKATINALRQESNGSQADSLYNLVSSITDGLMSKEYIEQKVIETVNIFHSFYGVKYKLGELIESEIELPIPTNNSQSVNAQCRIWLDEIDGDEETYSIYYEQKVDPETLKEVLNSTVKGLAEKLNVKHSAESIDDLLSQKTDYLITIYSVFDNTGWPLDIVSKTNINIGNTQQNNTVHIRLIGND